MSEVPDWMIDGSVEIPECQSCVESAKDYENLENIVGVLTQLVKRLVKALKKDNQDNTLSDNAMDYLKRKGLTKINLSRKADAD